MLRAAPKAFLVLLASCVPYSISVDHYPQTSVAPRASDAEVQVTENDDEHRPYDVLADITVHGRQITAFGTVPTRDSIKRKMATEAASLGADAVILVRFGTPGVGAYSWNELEGRGRAIRYRP